MQIRYKLRIEHILLFVVLAAAFAGMNSEFGFSLNTGNNTFANLTIWDSTDTQTLYTTNLTTFYANWTNLTTGKSINNSGTYCNITFSHVPAYLVRMEFNTTTLLYVHNISVATGLNNYTIICDGTALNYAIVNVTDAINVTNRAPVNDRVIPNITLQEETFNDTLNMTYYFADVDGHELNYTATTQDGNITITINNATKFANITLAHDFYGVRYANITAIDGFSGNVTSNIFWINVTNLIEINLSVPINSATGITATDTFNILATIEDDYNVTTCSLLLNGTKNITVNNPNLGRLQEIKYDDGAANTFHRPGSGPHGILTKKLNTTDTNIRFLAFFIDKLSSPTVMNITINDKFFTNFTTTELAYSCSTTPCWIYKPITNSSMLVAGTNNISFNAVYDGSNYWKVEVDNTAGSDVGMSSNTPGDITGEYMVRFQNISNILNFSNFIMPKGNYQWNVNCTNNQSTDNSATSNFTFSVANTAPTTPTLSPTSGTYDTEINISCSSTDSDNDFITYDLEYYSTSASSNLIMISNDDVDGNYSNWNTSLLTNNLRIVLKCTSNDGTTTSSIESDIITLSHPNAPSAPTNLTCNSGNCTRTFNETINLTTTGSNDTNGQFSYYFYATYDDVNGTQSYFIGSVSGLNSTNNTSTFIWNITQVSAQSGITIEVLAFDGLYNSSKYNLTSQATINNTNAPTRATNLNPNNGTYNISRVINITANGSTDINGDTLTYKVFAFYDNTWHLINSTLTNSTFFEWNFSNVPEQQINLSVQVTDGRYVSPILRSALINLAKPPTTPTNVTPSGNNPSNIYEYELNYSCSNSNNTNFFTYTIEINYSNVTYNQFFTLNETFPGIIPVNDTTLSYDDATISTLSYGGSYDQYYRFSSNISTGNYTICINGYGSNAKLDTLYNCNSLACDSCNNTGFQELSNTETSYCYSIYLSRQGNKNFCVKKRGVSDSISTSYVDSVILTAKPLTFNLTNITPQKNVQLRCKAQDDAGSSDYIYSNNTIIIDRIPAYNGDSSISFSAGNSQTINLSQNFSDYDGQNLTFYVPNYSSSLTLTYNFSSNNNVQIATSSQGSYYVTLYADDGLVNKTQNITVTVSASASQQVGGTGGGAGTTRAAVAATSEGNNAPPTPAAPPPAPPPASSAKEEPKPIIEEKPVEIKQTELSAARKISVISRKHPEPQSLFGTTKIFETIKNIDSYTVDDVKVKISIPKDIIKTTDEIAKDDTYYIIEKDPVIEFPLGSLEPREEKIISYTLTKTIDKSFITDEIFKVELSSRTLTPEEEAARQKEKEERIRKAKEVVNVSVSYNISKEGKAEITIDVKLLNKSLKAKDLSILSAIPKCLIALLDEEFRKKSLKSDIDFDVLKADPLTQMNLGDIDEDKQFKITLDKIADLNCDDPIEQEAIIKEIVPIVAPKLVKVDYARLSIVLVILLLGIVFYWKVSTSGEDKEKTERKKQHPAIIWLKKNTFFIILIAFFLLEIFDALGMLPADVELYKIITSFIAVGYIIYKVSITKVLFGHELKRVDFAIVMTFFLIIAKTTVLSLKNTFREAEFSSNLLVAILKVPALEEILLFTGAILFIIISIYLSKKLIIQELSLASLVLKPGDNPTISKLITKFAVIASLLGMFYVAIYQLSMEWFTIVIDSIVIIILAIIVLFTAIRKHQKHAVEESLEESESLVETAYKKFFKFFRFHKTAFLALAFISAAFIITDAFVYILPYTLGLAQTELYFTESAASHLPIFSMFGKESLFMQNITGLPIHGILIIALLYLLNVLGMLLLLGIPIYILAHVTKNIDKPLRHVDKSDLPTGIVALFIGSIITILFVPIFKIKRFASEFVAGVDIQTQFISTSFEPNLIGLLVASVILGYLLIHAIKKLREIKLHASREEHHYLIFGTIFALCITYILSFISKILFGKVLFISDIVKKFETSYIIFVLIASIIAAYLVYHYTHYSKRNELTFEYIVAGSVIIFFSAYYWTYVSDIALNHLNLFLHQWKIIEFTDFYSFRIYMRVFVLLFTGFLYLLEFLVLTASYLAFLYILYSRNELGIHKYNLPILRKFEQTYDLHHATAEIIASKKVINEARLALLQSKIIHGITSNYSSEEIIGHLISHDWHINDIHYAILHSKIDDDRKQELLYELYEFYSEEIDEILSETKNPINIAQDLALFDCTTEFIDYEINNSNLTQEIKQQILTELASIKKLLKTHYTAIEKNVSHIVEKEEELERKQEELEAQKEEEELSKKYYVSSLGKDKIEADIEPQDDKSDKGQDKLKVAPQNKITEKLFAIKTEIKLTKQEKNLFSQLKHLDKLSIKHELKKLLTPKKAFNATTDSIEKTKEIKLTRQEEQLFNDIKKLDRLDTNQEYRKLFAKGGFFHNAKQQINESLNKRKLKLNKSKIEKIKKQVMEKLSQGHKPSIVISYLEDSGYLLHDISTALFELEHNKEFHELLQKAEHPQESAKNEVDRFKQITQLPSSSDVPLSSKIAASRMLQILNLKNKINSELKHKKLHNIVAELLAKGIHEDDIAEALKELRLEREEDKLIGKYRIGRNN